MSKILKNVDEGKISLKSEDLNLFFFFLCNTVLTQSRAISESSGYRPSTCIRFYFNHMLCVLIRILIVFSIKFWEQGIS